MAGRANLPENVKRDLSRWVDLRGIVPRTEVADEYRWADVFLLPSICEGSATVVYEALAAGLPVVTTENTGSVVRHGLEGFIVPIRNAEAIALALEELAENADLRASMSANALRRSAEFTVEEYGKRLLSALSKLPATRPMGAIRRCP
jgi:glycosyltransferase involved in cell wall biosynthesis